MGHMANKKLLNFMQNCVPTIIMGCMPPSIQSGFQNLWQAHLWILSIQNLMFFSSMLQKYLLYPYEILDVILIV